MQPAFSGSLFFRLGPGGSGRIPARATASRACCHSDALYSAVSAAMARLGLLEEWLGPTVGAATDGAAVRFSSCYPFSAKLLFVIPPASLWPPAPSLKVRWKGARFVPLSVVEDLLAGRRADGRALEGGWRQPVPGARGMARTCGDRSATAVRSGAAVDRLSGGVVDRTARRVWSSAREPGCGRRGRIRQDEAQERWVETGARRPCGCWRIPVSGAGGPADGAVVEPEFQPGGALPELVLRPELSRRPGRRRTASRAPPRRRACWLLSLFSPAETGQRGLEPRRLLASEPRRQSREPRAWARA